MEDKNIKKDEKWGFSDYAFTITGIIVGVLLVGPQLLYSWFGISILGGDLSDTMPTLLEGFEDGYGHTGWSFNQLRALSPMLFLLTTTIVFFKEAFDARKDGGYTGSIFTHTFESLFEDAIYMAITTIMVYSAILAGAMYASWLAGPISWVLFVLIFPLVRKKRSGVVEVNDVDETDKTDEVNTPWLLLAILAIGIIAEVITRAWVAFPLAWLVICTIMLTNTIREGNHTVDTVFDMIYLAFSVALMAVGVVMGFWMVSWAAFPIALLICWILSKFKRFKKVKEQSQRRLP